MRKVHAGIVSLALLQTIFAVSAMAVPFQPPQTARVKLNINQTWKFTMADVSGAQATGFNDAAWSTVHLPHNFQNVSITGGTYYRGIGWYRKHFTLDASYSGKRITIYFEGAMTVAQVYINGTALATHYGGFDPFCYDITSYCAIGGADNVIAVRLDNSYQNLVPPEKPGGGSIDFEMYGGIYRDVWIIATDPVFVPEAVHDWANSWANQGGHFITFANVSAGSANVTVRTWVRNAGASSATCYVATTIADATNEIIQTGTSASQAVAANSVSRFAQTITVANPVLWYPWAPYRYTVHTVVYNGTAVVDYYKTRIGIRQLQFTRTTGAFVNGTYIKLLGLNRHQTWPFVGHAVPNIQQRRDAEMLKDVSCNIARCSHYLQDDEFMNACDSLGIFLWVEIPGWHCCDNPATPSTNATWRARHFDVLKSTVRTARNHPCVAIWGPGINEAVSDPTIERPLNDTCHKEDSSRMTSVARAGWQHPTGAGNNIYDVYGDNQFTPGSIPASNPDPNCYGYINTEHTGHTAEQYSRRETNTESDLLYHGWLHAQMTGEARAKGTWILGGMGWCMFDYYTGGSIRYHGVMDLMHIPKFGYWVYKSQSAADNYNGTVHPVMKITNWYRSASPVNRDVYHNCDSVRLYRNGTYVASKPPDVTIAGLAHHPSTFFNVAFQTGMLTAEGFQGGRIVVRDTARTPGAAACIRLVADPPVIQANGGDFSRVEAWIIDASGTYVPYTANSISFTISGTAGGSLVGNNPIAAQSGACIILAKAGLTPGSMRVTATSAGLCTVSADIVVSPTTGIFDGYPGAAKTAAIVPKTEIFAMMGNRFIVPGPFQGKSIMVAVYDLSGKMIYKKAMRQKVIALGKDIATASGIHIVHINTVPE